MRVGEGGYRPGYSCQLTTDVASALVCGASVTNWGSDQGELVPLAGRLERSFGIRPVEVLVDGGYVTLPDIEALERSARRTTRRPRRRGRGAIVAHTRACRQNAAAHPASFVLDCARRALEVRPRP
ncbi:MAG: hypothetical protein Q8M74_01605 [Chloroflexota bacterium]|nr:hypothetical protein [Chloroflexota bacterium]